MGKSAATLTATGGLAGLVDYGDTFPAFYCHVLLYTLFHACFCQSTALCAAQARLASDIVGGFDAVATESLASNQQALGPYFISFEEQWTAAGS